LAGVGLTVALSTHRRSMKHNRRPLSPDLAASDLEHHQLRAEALYSSENAGETTPTPKNYTDASPPPSPTGDTGRDGSGSGQQGGKLLWLL
jgi:hypothetical protein